MIGSGNRAEKIRTYRYKDNQVVDHRVGSSFNLADLTGGNMQPLGGVSQPQPVECAAASTLQLAL